MSLFRVFSRSCLASLAAPALSAGFWLTASLVPAAAQGNVHLQIVGGLAGVTQYKEFEEPFWRDEIRQRSAGRVTASISPFDQSGLRGQDMLQLMRLGVVPFGNANLSMVDADEPELGALDLPALNPDLDTLRRNVEAYRPTLSALLRDRYGVELLGIYTYPAQVLFCAKPFVGLGDIAGRKVRTSSRSQSELVSALGGTPVVIPFSSVADATRQGVVDCAITGTLSGVQVGLSDVTTHIHSMAVGWGIGIFGANADAWRGLEPDVRAIVSAGVGDLEARIWDAVHRDTERGYLCATGKADCVGAAKGRMTMVKASAEDEVRRRELLTQAILPRWLERCHKGCVSAWNDTLGRVNGLMVDAAGMPMLVQPALSIGPVK